MISLDQVHVLEKKVESAVSKIIELKNENTALKNRISILEKENTDLNSKVSVFEREQNRVEESILSVLNRLDVVEDTVSTSAPASQSSVITETEKQQTVEAEPAEMDIRIHENDSVSNATLEIPAETESEAASEDSFSPKQAENGQFDIF